MPFCSSGNFANTSALIYATFLASRRQEVGFTIILLRPLELSSKTAPVCSALA
jgi:hypothetical protein